MPPRTGAGRGFLAGEAAEDREGIPRRDLGDHLAARLDLNRCVRRFPAQPLGELARVVDAEVGVGHAPERFDADGELLDENLKEQLQEAADTLLAELPARVAIAA